MVEDTTVDDPNRNCIDVDEDLDVLHDPNGRPRGVLSDQDIVGLELISLGTFSRDCLQPASYDLRLGDVFLQFDTKGNGHFVNAINAGLPSLKLRPFEPVLFSTKEKVQTKKNIIGRFDLKVRYALNGIILQVGPQVEPCYTGPLFGCLLNVSGKERSIEFGKPFLSIEFSYTRIAPAKAKPFKIDNFQDFLNKLNINIDEISVPSIMHHFKTEIDKCKDDHAKIAQLNDGLAQSHQGIIGEKTLKWTRRSVYIGAASLSFIYKTDIIEFAKHILRYWKLIE